MGLTQSLNDDNMTESISSQPSLILKDFNKFITEDLLIDILSHVPAKDLILNCRLVCKNWKSVIDAQSIWKLKCEREHVRIPSRKFEKLPQHYYRYIYCHAVTESNLIVNPCGERRLEGWRFPNERDSRCQVENPPSGSDPVPAEVGSQSCFATSFTMCQKYQTINFRDNPIHSYLLHHDLVKIEVGEWYAARWDCASEYAIRVILYDENKAVIEEFAFKYNEDQWLGKEWHLVRHEFNDDVSKVHTLQFFHQGKDRQYWAGYYGSKMTGSFVKLTIK